MNMRSSIVLKKLKNGELVNCAKINLADSRAAELAAMHGFDSLWLDMEHISNDWSVIERQVLAAKAHNADSFVRIARGSYSDYIRPLEMDATGIMVPHIMNLEDAKRVVEITRFYPIGRRPVDGGNADGAYTNIPSLDYFKQANTERFVILQIEDYEPLDELDAIADLEGIDMLFFGPADFSQSIGAPCQWDNPKIKETFKRVAKAATAHNKFAGTVSGILSYEELIDMGYRFFNLGADVIGMNQHFKEVLDNFAKLV